tara:strand:- start:62 stop:247 length:186 start_codon:yes stop_codon:yes gene_type:complete
MQIYEFIANTFILAISLCIMAVSTFFFFVTGDVTLERVGINENVRYIIIFISLALIIILLT